MEGKKRKKEPPVPQLARPCYNVDSSSSSSDEENGDCCIVHHHKSNNTCNDPTNNVTVAKKRGSWQDDDDDDDASLEILPPVHKKPKPLTKVKTESGKLLQVKPTPPSDNIAESTTILSYKDRTEFPMESQDTDDESYCITLKENKSFQKNAPPDVGASVVATRKTTTSVSSSAKRSRFLNDFEFSPNSSTDDDDDDDLLLKKPTFESRESIKERKKREREQQKQQEKLSKAQKRHEDKLARQRQKEQEKAAKTRENQAHAQANGKYKHEEIAILMDPRLYDEDPLGLVKKLSEDFLVHSYPSKLSMAYSAIQFVRKDHLQGGAKDAVTCLEAKKREEYEHVQYLVLVIDPADFIPLLRRDDKDEDDDYPRLAEWLVAVKSRWQTVWKTLSSVEPTIILILHNLSSTLDKMWVEHRRRYRTEPSLPTAWELQDAILWLLVQFQVECIQCPTLDLIQLTIHKMTRSLCDKPYAVQVTELECIRKIKHTSLELDDPVDKARDVWLRQLQQIPRLSENMARNVVEHYPTCQSLWQAYQQQEQNIDRTNTSPASLLSNILRAGRTEQKLSDAVFRIMTSNDPMEMLL